MTIAASLIPQKLAESIPALGLRKERNSLIVGLPDTFNDQQIDAALDRLVSALKMNVEAVMVETEILSRSIEFAYINISSGDVSTGRGFKGRGEGQIIELVDELLKSALKMRASDIHIEPLNSELLIRVRIDGKLQELTRMDITIAPAIVSRVKVLGRMSIVERRKPQDGQFTHVIDGREIDIRISTISTLFGEKAALRLLDTERGLADLKELGMSDETYNSFNRILKARHGLIIAAGPTGSGKTTTMHSALQIVNSPELNVCTIEDPVEYVISGINHVPVSEQANLTFATQLRALLRQDPDIVLVGEIRDPETARIAVQAALAGRLVLTTLHATDALGSIFRLFQMGIEPYQVAASLVGVVSQRLVRRNCIYCVESSHPSKSQQVLISKEFGAKKLNFQQGKGCTICNFSGYFNRVGAFELLEIEESMREMIAQRPTPNQLELARRKLGNPSLHEEVLNLVAQGVTSINEALELEIEI